jgi:CRISPR-associated endonuclease/helicase Cas3
MPDPDPDVALWLHGPQSGAPDVQIVWRTDLTEDLLKLAVDSGPDAERAKEFAIGMVEALPPVAAEAMSVPFVAAKRWLECLSEPGTADVEGAADPDQDSFDPQVEPAPRPALVWQGEQSRVVVPRKLRPGQTELRPGQTIVVPSSYGGIEHHNWAPASSVPVKDVAELATLRHRGRPMLRMHEQVVRNLFGPEIAIPKLGGVESEEPNDYTMAVAWLEDLSPPSGDSGLRELIDTFRDDKKWIRVERLPLAPGEDAGEYFLITGRRRRPHVDDDGRADDRVTTEDSKSSFTGVEVTLADHLAAVAQTAAGFAERLGLPDDLVADLRFSGEWHDAGKADSRFQRWLHGGSEFKALTQKEPLAKSRTRVASPSALRVARERAGYPNGGRHELTSLVLMESAADPLAPRAGDWTLVRHLIACHHGYCRPLAPWVPDPNPVDVMFSRDGITCAGSSAHELARLDSGIAERFWQMVSRYGWWGLAWVEALLRLADHRQSEREQLSNEKRDA